MQNEKIIPGSWLYLRFRRKEVREFERLQNRPLFFRHPGCDYLPICQRDLTPGIQFKKHPLNRILPDDSRIFEDLYQSRAENQT